MFRPPDYNHNLSMRLSAVLHDIGVTENMVKKTRRMWMIHEALANTCHLLLDNKTTSLFFGSQSEASTTGGLNSDIDHLMWPQEFHVIQDWSQWQPNGKHQYLIVQDETTSSGYCLLQLIRHDAPLPAVNIQDDKHSTDSIGRVLMRHSIVGFVEGFSQHGPAQTDSGPDRRDIDFVPALHCPFWPREPELWLHQQNESGWPTDDMKGYSAQQGCFVVPVGSRTGIYQDLEWRISTSFAERCLMYNINITQIRCYILMKMIVKTFIQPKCGDVVSSFMCKNILFYCIAGAAASSTWNDGSLLTWLNQCLQSLFHCILTGNCPHFVIPWNNLLAGKLSAEVKAKLADVMCTLTANIEQSLLGIQIDDFCYRLHVKSGSILSGVDLSDDTTVIATGQNISLTAQLLMRMSSGLWNIVPENVDAPVQSYSNTVSKLCQLYLVGSHFEKVAISLLASFLCTSIGSMTASVDINQTRAITPEAFRWFALGLNSDVSSSRLKLASALYCTGYLERCKMILTAVQAQLSQTSVQTICYCYPHGSVFSKDFAKLCYENNENAIKDNIAFCVWYLPFEVNCIPVELRYEMFRSTEEDHSYRGRWDIWMDWAVVDSLPYLYFLQYKVYSQLQRPEEKHRALYNLTTLIHTDKNLGHRETALNLLGQCMEQEGRHQDALYCYMMSLKIRGRNNAARWHVCRLLVRLFHRQGL